MRSHGVANFPEPIPVTHDGKPGFLLDTGGIDTSSPTYLAAGTACRSLEPAGMAARGAPLSPAQQRAWLTWAACIRSHGFPTLPDPTFSGSGVLVPQVTNSSAFASAERSCESKRPS